jgi:hypothetical protein
MNADWVASGGRLAFPYKLYGSGLPYPSTLKKRGQHHRGVFCSIWRVLARMIY